MARVGMLLRGNVRPNSHSMQSALFECYDPNVYKPWLECLMEDDNSLTEVFVTGDTSAVLKSGSHCNIQNFGMLVMTTLNLKILNIHTVGDTLSSLRQSDKQVVFPERGPKGLEEIVKTTRLFRKGRDHSYSPADSNGLLLTEETPPPMALVHPRCHFRFLLRRRKRKNGES